MKMTTPSSDPSLLKAMVDATPDFMVVKDTELLYRAANAAFLRFIGKSEEAVIGRSDLDLFPESEALKYREDDRHVLATGESIIRDEYTSGAQGPRWVQVAKVPLRRGDGTVEGVLVTVRDITDRRRAQEAIQAERQRLLAILDTLPVYLALLTPDYHIAFANRFFRERFGEARGKRCFDHLFGRDAPCEVCESFNALERDTPLEWEWTGPDGREYYVYDFPFTESDGSKLILEAGLDVTALKRAEAAVRQLNTTLEGRVAERTAALEAANRELEAFSYSVSHDLRGPLRAINGFAEVLREDYGERLDEVGLGYLGRMRDATLRMGELVDGLLVLSRIMRSELKSASVNLSGLAEGIARQLQLAASGREVTWEIEPDLVATGDPALLRSLLQNLLDNAWKFTARCEQARITVGRQWQNGREVFFVRDNGVGFESEYAHKLFEPFERLHGNAEYDGSGIGLATVRRIVQRHGGAVWAEGEPGEGATIFFTLGRSPAGAE